MFLDAEQNEDGIFFGEEWDATRRFCKSTKQTAVLTRAFQTSSRAAFAASERFLSYCFACIRYFGCSCVWTALFNFCAVMKCSPLPTQCETFTVPPQTESVIRWRTGSEVSNLGHTHPRARETTKPSSSRKYHHSLQTLKPFRWSSPQSVSWHTLYVLVHLL